MRRGAKCGVDLGPFRGRQFLLLWMSAFSQWTVLVIVVRAFVGWLQGAPLPLLSPAENLVGLLACALLSCLTALYGEWRERLGAALGTLKGRKAVKEVTSGWRRCEWERLPRACCWFHAWHLHRFNGVHAYHYCTRCGARDAVHLEGAGHSPPDERWLWDLEGDPYSPFPSEAPVFGSPPSASPWMD